TLQSGGRYAFSSLQVHDFTFTLQEIKFTPPIVTNGEDVNAILIYICLLLFPGAFWYHQINVLDGFDNGSTLLVGNQNLFALELVEFIGGYGNDDSLSHFGQPFKQVEVANVEHVEGAVSDYGSFHE